MRKFVSAPLRALVCAVLCLASLATNAKADTFSWATLPETNLLLGNDTRTSTPAGVTLTSSATSTGATAQNVTIQNGTPTGSIYPSVVRFQMTAPNNTENSATMAMTMTFSVPVYNVSFRVTDIDGGPTYNDGNRFNDFVYATANGGTLPTSVGLTNNAFLEYSAALGRVRTIQTLNTGTTNSDGDATFNFAGPVTSITVTYRNGPSAAAPTNQWVFLDDITFFRAPQLRLAKSTNAGSGNFTFTTSNSGSGTTNTNVVAGTTAVNSPFVTLNSLLTATTVTETGPAGWIINNGNVTCADSNNAISGNAATFNGVISANSVLTVAAANIRGSAVITCTVVNQSRPSVQVIKTTQGAIGSFSFTGTNFPGDTVATLVTNTATPGTARTLPLAATATTIVETAVAGWEVNGTPTCTVNGVGQAITWTAATRTIGLTVAQTAAGNAIVCTFVNRRLPRVTVQKTTLGGVGGAFTFTQTGLAAINSITTTVINTPTASTSGALLGTVGGATSVTEGAMPAATWRFADVSCTDANSALSGNPANVGVVAGQAVTLTAAMVAGADIFCTFRNGRIPTVAVRKTTMGNAAASPNFTFTQTNLSANPAARSTTGHNTPSAYTATVNVNNNANPVTITEAVATGYYFGSANCVDTNSVNSGNPAGAGTFGTTIAPELTILAANVPYGAVVQCTFTNNVIPTMTVRKTTIGGVGGPFTFTQGNLVANPSPVTTSVAGTPANGAPASVNVAAVGTDVTVTENAFAGYFITGANCTDSNAAITGNAGTFGSLAGSQLTVPLTSVVAGAQFVCTFTNTLANPLLQLTKSASPAGPKNAGDVVTYTFTVVNTGNVPITNININELAFDGYNTNPVPWNETQTGTDVAPTGDSSDPSGVNGVWNLLGPGDTVTFTANYTVNQQDIDLNQ